VARDVTVASGARSYNVTIDNIRYCRIPPDHGLSRKGAYTNMDVQPVTQGVQDLFITLEISRARSARLWGRSAVEISALVFVGLGNGVTPHAIASRLSLTTGSVTALLDRLQVAGLIERHSNPDDRRSLLIAATDEGRQMAEEFVGALDRVIADAVRDIDPVVIEQTQKVLATIKESLLEQTPVSRGQAVKKPAVAG
jgi:DNA-binding MarR family transcriptional regulator